MKTLFVLYDGECGFCQKCREWLARQPAFVELRFIPMQSAEVLIRFPGIQHYGLGEEMIVVSDEGAVYRGPAAYVMCLYALVEYREWSERLSNPLLLPLARQVFLLISRNRQRLSRWFFSGSPETVRKRLESESPESCMLDRAAANRRTLERSGGNLSTGT